MSDSFSDGGAAPRGAAAIDAHAITMAAGLVALATVAGLIAGAGRESFLFDFGTSLGILALAGVSAALARRGHGLAAALILSGAVAVGGLALVALDGPSSARVGLLFVAVILSGLALSPWVVLGVSCLVVAGYFGVVIADARGLIDYVGGREPRGLTVAIEIALAGGLSAALLRERHLARTRARQGERRVIELIHRTPFGMALVDEHRRLRSLNPALAEAVGATPAQLMDRTLDDVGLGVLFDCALARGGEPLEMWIGKAKNPRWVEASIRPLDEGEGSAFLFVVRDVEPLRRAESERRGLEQQLDQARRLESLGRLAGGVAHDFNNILQVILAQADMLASGRGGPSSPREILAAAERAEGLTRQLLAFSHAQHDSLEEVELDAAVAETAPILRRLLAPGTELSVEAGAPGFIAPISRAKLDQILLGLVTSAQEAMPEGGLVHVATRIEASPEGTRGVVTVRDAGVGIEGAARKDFGGAPRGIETLEGLVRGVGGVVKCDGRPGVGTEVHVSFPEVELRARATPTPEETLAPGEAVGRTVLLVDDDEQVRTAVGAQLTALGCTILHAADGDAAEALARLHSGDIDLVLSDVILRRESGPDVARRLARVLPSVEVLYISGYPAGVLAWYGLTDAGDRLMSKPVGMDELRRRLHWGFEHTERNRAERSEARRAG